MKRAFFFVAPMALALIISANAFAADGEWTVTVGCAHCNYEADTKAGSCAAAGKTADGKVVLLKGDAVKELKFKKGGDYKVTGTLSADGKTIEVKEIKAKA
jgi:hypothetical protein